MKKLVKLFAVILVLSVVFSCNKKEEKVVEVKPAIEKPVVEKPAPVIKPLSEQVVWSHRGGELDYETLKPYLNKYEGWVVSPVDNWFQIENLEAMKYYLGYYPELNPNNLKLKVDNAGRLVKYADNSIKWFNKDGVEKETRKEAHKRRGHDFNSEALLK